MKKIRVITLIKLKYKFGSLRKYDILMTSTMNKQQKTFLFNYRALKNVSTYNFINVTKHRFEYSKIMFVVAFSFSRRRFVSLFEALKLYKSFRAANLQPKHQISDNLNIVRVVLKTNFIGFRVYYVRPSERSRTNKTKTYHIMS